MKPLRCLLVTATFWGCSALPLAIQAQLAPTTPTPAVGTNTFTPTVPPAPVTHPSIPPAPSHLPPAPLATQRPLPSGILAFDEETKATTVKPGELAAKYLFLITNVSPAEVVISLVKPSCGCTTAQLPPMPWRLGPGDHGEIPVTMNVQGKSGLVMKTITIYTEQGQKTLMLKTTIQAFDPQRMTAADRDRNLLLAKADRQAVFKGDCAHCHVEPVIGKMGKGLYDAACGICHEAEHRATMVPDLHNLPNDTNPEYWKLMSTVGKTNTLMPAFAQAHGGPLSDAQVNSLVAYLGAHLPAQGTNSRPVLAKP